VRPSGHRLEMVRIQVLERLAVGGQLPGSELFFHCWAPLEEAASVFRFGPPRFEVDSIAIDNGGPEVVVMLRALLEAEP